MIGHRLKLARAAAGLSLRELEERIDNLVSAQALNKYEHDEMMPTSAVLIAVCRALGVTPDYLLSAGELALEDVAFRTEALGARDRARVEAQVLGDMERYLAIEDLLNVASSSWDKPREAPFPVDELPDADRAARSLRGHWQLGLDPIPNFAEFLEERGLKVVLADMPEPVDGLTCLVRRKNRDDVPAIVINTHERLSGERERFTLAHEVGHLLILCGSDVDRERACNRFAGAFLMPAEVLWAEVGKRRDALSLAELIELKRVFQVSIQMLVHRCFDLKIISEELYKSLFRDFKEKGWRDPPYEEPIKLPKQPPRRFQRLVYRAVAEEVVSRSRAAELLRISVRELDKRLDAA